MTMFEDRNMPSPIAPSAREESASPAFEKFRSCRWHLTGEQGTADHCTHRDVLPFAGTTGFSPEAWCPDCEFYKLRRTPRKKERDDAFRY